jgi:hypothetical protein
MQHGVNRVHALLNQLSVLLLGRKLSGCQLGGQINPLLLNLSLGINPGHFHTSLASRIGCLLGNPLALQTQLTAPGCGLRQT